MMIINFYNIIMKKWSKSNFSLKKAKKWKENNSEFNVSYKVPFLWKKSNKIGIWKKSLKKGGKSKNHDFLVKMALQWENW